MLQIGVSDKDPHISQKHTPSQSVWIDFPMSAETHLFWLSRLNTIFSADFSPIVGSFESPCTARNIERGSEYMKIIFFLSQYIFLA